MKDKSHVGMGHEVCPICYQSHTETVLLDRSLRDTLAQDNLTGWSLCPEHEAMAVEYVGLVEVDKGGPNLKPWTAKPTGNYAHIRREKAPLIFNVPLPDSVPFAYVEVGVIDKLRSLHDDATEGSAS